MGKLNFYKIDLKKTEVYGYRRVLEKYPCVCGELPRMYNCDIKIGYIVECQKCKKYAYDEGFCVGAYRLWIFGKISER